MGAELARKIKGAILASHAAPQHQKPENESKFFPIVAAISYPSANDFNESASCVVRS
ncbi:MAG: hypothetical protein L6Q40_13435 [Azonexus sp.]|nr:hypothetical protein [Azonexus sp.]